MIERLSLSDLSMLIPDELGWPQEIAAIGILQLQPGDDAEQLLARLRTRVASSLHSTPRFTQLVVTPPRGLGVPYWAAASDFSISRHVRIEALSTVSDDRTLFSAFESLRVRRLDRARPLWEIVLLPNLPGMRVGLVVRMHHAVADGLAGLAQMMAFFDASISPPLRAATPPSTRRSPPTNVELFIDNVRRRAGQLAKALFAILRPLRLYRRSRPWRAFLREVLRGPRAPRTSLQQRVGPHRRIEIVRATLAEIKSIAHAHGAKINDVVLALMTSGAGALLAARGEATQGVVLRASVPIAQHPDAQHARGNHDGGMLVPLPIGRDLTEPARLRAIARDTAARKQQPHPNFDVDAFPGTLLILRRMLRGMGTQRLANLYATSIAGPPMPLFLAGAELLELFPVVPLNGNCTVGLGALSYAGHFAITAVADDDACPDLRVFVDGVRYCLDALRSSLRQSRVAAIA